MDVNEIILAFRAPEVTPEFQALHEYLQKACEAGLLTDADLAKCKDAECIVCGSIVCPHAEPLHFHHDGCPACSLDDLNSPRA